MNSFISLFSDNLLLSVHFATQYLSLRKNGYKKEEKKSKVQRDRNVQKISILDGLIVKTPKPEAVSYVPTGMLSLHVDTYLTRLKNPMIKMYTVTFLFLSLRTPACRNYPHKL